MMSKSKQRIDLIRKGIIPDGYKKTKAGIIPADWEIHPLSQHLSESRVPGSNGSVAKKLTVKLWNKGVFEKREVHSGSESTKYYKRKKGQFIYSKLDFLNCAFGIIPEELDGYESTIDLPCFDILGVNDYYLLSYITQPEFYTHYGMLADGGRKARRVDPEEMLSFPLIFPPLPEQQKIAKILSTQDKVIELKEKLLEQKQIQKKWLMQKLLSNDGAIFTLGGVRIDKSGWKKEKLGNITEISTGNKDTQDKIDDGEYPFYVRSPIPERINSYSYDGEAILTAGDGVGVGKVIHYVNGKFDFHQRVYKISDFDKELALGKYVYYYFVEYFYDRVKRMSAKNSVDSVRFDMISGMSIFLPPLQEQQTIAEVLSTADKEIDLLKSDIEQEKQKKKALMQLLLTGIVRVKVNE